jgi:hypothetical protein
LGLSEEERVKKQAVDNENAHGDEAPWAGALAVD